MTARVKADAPIGIFDSGIGGLTVANAIRNVLPKESIIYFGDTAHLPYGEKSADAIRSYALQISKFLLDKQCKMIVIACNSASSAAYDLLLDFFDGKILFINVVDPLVHVAVGQGYDRIGIIATKATVQSKMYPNRIRQINQSIRVSQLATPLLVPMIEEGFYQEKISSLVLENYLSNSNLKDIDALLLACTHYPLIRKQIEAHFENRVAVLDSTLVTAQAVRHTLENHALLADEPGEVKHRFFVSDYTESFERTTKRFYGEAVRLVQHELW